MLNKLSFNLMNELNESETEAYKIKKKVIMESNCVKTINEVSETSSNKFVFTDDMNYYLKSAYDAFNQSLKDTDEDDIKNDYDIMNNNINHFINLLNKEYDLNANKETLHYEISEIIQRTNYEDAKEDINKYLNNQIIGYNWDNLNYDKIQNLSDIEKQDLWMNDHTKPFENTEEGWNMFWDWVKEKFPVKELNDSEEPTHQVLNEENSDVVDRLFSGNELYFRDADGTAIMIHYADNYPQPEEYDEGYKTEFGGSEEALNAAQLAAENGDVWELVEVDNEGNSTGTIYGYAYGIDELKEYLKDLREVKVKKSLEEDMIDDNIEAARQDSIEKGLISEEEDEDNSEVEKIKDKYLNLIKNIFQKSRTAGKSIDNYGTDIDSLFNDFREEMMNAGTTDEEEMNEIFYQGLYSAVEHEDSLRHEGPPSKEEANTILQDKIKMLEDRLADILVSIQDKQMDTEEFRALSREAAEIDSQITDLENQINGLYESEEEPNKENQEVKKKCNTPITEATVSGKTLLKNQGNIYMFECKGNKDFTHIVGENYNESENLLENVETYTSKEEADKDYLDRCGLTEGYTSKDLAKDGGKYKKIDLYVDGKYETSTNSYKTVKEAIAALKNKDEYKDKKVTGEFSKQ